MEEDMGDTAEIVRRVEQALRDTVDQWGELACDVDYLASDPQCDESVSYEVRLDVSVCAREEEDIYLVYVAFDDDDSRGRVLDDTIARAAMKNFPECEDLDEEGEALQEEFEWYAKHRLTPLIKGLYPDVDVDQLETGRFLATYGLWKKGQ